jgi:hypothetical protein
MRSSSLGFPLFPTQMIWCYRTWLQITNPQGQDCYKVKWYLMMTFAPTYTITNLNLVEMLCMNVRVPGVKMLFFCTHWPYDFINKQMKLKSLWSTFPHTYICIYGGLHYITHVDYPRRGIIRHHINTLGYHSTSESQLYDLQLSTYLVY